MKYKFLSNVSNKISERENSRDKFKHVLVNISIFS